MQHAERGILSVVAEGVLQRMTQRQVAQEVSEVQAGAGVNGFIRIEIEFPVVNSASDHKARSGKYHRKRAPDADIFLEEIAPGL